MDHNQVVRIFATTQAPDYECPWQTEPPRSSTGSGVIIGPGRVLTGAHVVADSTFLQVQTVADPEKSVAVVEAVCHDCDLALLRVDDPAFAPDVTPAVIGDLPQRRNRVSVVGFPVGGEEISITEGVVSRIEVQRYTHSQRDLLAVTVDAAINDGNSGGPVFRNGRVAGIAFQTMADAEKIGEMVPAPLIHRFLRGVDERRPIDIPGFGMWTQDLENPRLREHLGLVARESGLLVTAIEHGGTADGVLQPGDVLMELDGHRIANNGTVQAGERFRTRFAVLLCERYIGDEVPIVLRRGAERIATSLELREAVELVPRSRYDTLPSYFVFGGLVFQPLTRNFLVTWEDWMECAPKEFLNFYDGGHRTPERQEIIVLSQVLADPLNVGYGPLQCASVDRVNGIVPHDMRAFVQALDAASGTLELSMSGHTRMILQVDEARDAHARILRRYQIPRDRSDDLNA
jgi:S1-C subfamily serine protease